ncbi:MAG: aldo/keto reductase [Aquimonas sp.]|jgi:predicted oxidoreductase
MNSTATRSLPRPRFHGLSPVVAGCWRMAGWGMDVDARIRWIEGCLELGVTSFDHADIYGDYAVEGLFGEALARAPGLRQRLQLVSKCGIRLVSPARPGHRIKSYDTSAAHIVASVDHSLHALRTDHLDLLLIHRPDPLLDVAEVAGAFERLQRAGKVLRFGVSNFSPAQFELLDSAVELVTQQVELSPLARAVLHDGTLDQCQQLGVQPMLWSPLAGGRVLKGEGEDGQRVRVELDRIGAELGESAASVAYAWGLRHPSRPLAITGSQRLEGIAEAVAATRLQLSREAWHALWTAGAGMRVP